ncbi:DUF3786 domain-containing protein, partial [Candidatus Bathyarchaeota archaeon]|nr:DUF3786 domain-containing protein [Candidatus Bathyarchaeota archaeon]
MDIRARVVQLLRHASGFDFSEVVCGRVVVNNGRSLEAEVLGVKYKAEIVDNDNVRLRIFDPLNRTEDSSRLIEYLLNAIERALKHGIPKSRGNFIRLAQLPGGCSAQLYERRITNFLMAEMEGSTVKEVEASAKAIGGCLVEHASADWSIEVSPFSDVRIRVAYWQGEEEMPSNVTILVGEEAIVSEVPIQELIVLIEMAVNRFVQFYRR